MYCPNCGAEAADGSSFCSKCGKPLGGPPLAGATPTDGAPAPINVVVQAPDARPYGTPGTGALWLSILGFCGITAVLGVVFGIAARAEAKRRGVSSAKATWAIVIGLVWLLPLAISVVSVFVSQGSNQASSTPPPAPATAPAAPSGQTDQPQVPFAEQARKTLVRLKFECDAPKGAEDWVQCRKGTYDDPTYGPSPVEMVNIWANQNGTGGQYVEGYVKPATYKELKKVSGRWTYSGEALNGTKDLTGSPSS